MNSFVQLLASIVGLFTIKELINLIGGYIGGKNALDEGKQMSDQVKKTVGSVVEKGLMFSGGAAAAIKAGKFARDEAKGAGELNLDLENFSQIWVEQLKILVVELWVA